MRVIHVSIKLILIKFNKTILKQKMIMMNQYYYENQCLEIYWNRQECVLFMSYYKHNKKKKINYWRK